MLTQKQMIDKFLPLIEEKGEVYIKSTEVNARPAKEGEVIETFTSDGKETQNTAKKGDWVIKNKTEAKEEYIISGEKLRDRYIVRSFIKDGWYSFKAKGQCQAFEYDGEDMEFMASWNEKMTLKKGDMLATPLPDKKEVYRIAVKEFNETYKLKK
jgi:hypothetical protein